MVKTIVILFSIILPVLAMAIELWSLAVRKILSGVYILFGILIYIASRVIVTFGYQLFFGNEQVSTRIMTSILQVILLSLTATGAYYLLVRSGSDSSGKRLSAGFAAGSAETILIILPVVMNNLFLDLAIMNGDVSSFLGKSIEVSQMNDVIQLFSERPVSYFLYLGLFAFANIIVQSAAAFLCADKRGILDTIVLLLTFYSSCYLLPSVDYGVSCAAIAAISVFCLFILKKSVSAQCWSRTA